VDRIVHDGRVILFLKTFHEGDFSKHELGLINNFIKRQKSHTFIYKFQEILPGDSKKYLSISYSESDSNIIGNKAYQNFSNLKEYILDLLENRHLLESLKVSKFDQEKINLSLIKCLKILGFKGIKETVKSLKNLEYISLVAINLGTDNPNEEFSLFPILITCSNFKVSLKFVVTKDTKWFVCEERFLTTVEKFLNDVLSALHPSEKLVYDSTSKGVCLITEFLFYEKFDKELEIQREFLRRFFYSLSNFTIVSRYLWTLLSGKPVDIEILLNELNNIKRIKNFNLNNPKIDEPRIIFPDEHEKVKFEENPEDFEKEVEIIEKLKQSSHHFYWIEINYQKKSIKYPKFNGFPIIQYQHHSLVMKKLIIFFLEMSKSGYLLVDFFENLMIFEENSSIIFYIKHNNFRNLFTKHTSFNDLNQIYQILIEKSLEKVFQIQNNLKKISLSDFDSFDSHSMTGRLINEDVYLISLEEFTSKDQKTKENFQTFGYIELNSLKMIVYRVKKI
jgi:hypothetical protein